MTPSERFTAREERQHAMQTRIERANEAYARFHEPTDAEIDAELKRRKEEAMSICYCGMDEGTNLDCDRCKVFQNSERLAAIEQAIFGEVTTGEQVAAKIKLQIETQNQERKLGS